MVTKRGQLKIQQMVFMIIAVTLFLVISGMFILVIKFSDIQQRAEGLQEENAKLLVSKIAESPEFSCGDSYGTGLTSCIDLDKVINLGNRLSKYGYGDFWGIEGLEIRTISPLENQVECTSRDYPNCNTFVLISGEGTGVSNFVSLCKRDFIGDETQIKCTVGKIIVVY